MKQEVVIAVDALTEKNGPEAVNAVQKYAREHPLVGFQVFGPTALITSVLFPGNVQLIGTSEVVTMTDSPREGWKKQESPTLKALKAVAGGGAHVCVSSANTGALTLAVSTLLKRIFGILPLASLIPKEDDGYTVLLDTGSTTNITPDKMVLMGLMAQVLFPEEANLRVGMLTIGTEIGKGTEFQKAAFKLLQAVFPDIFNVEPAGVLSGSEVDIALADCLTGNMFVKSAGAMLALIADMIEEKIPSVTATADELAVKRRIQRLIGNRFQINRMGGAVFLGTEIGTAVKTHGGSTEAMWIGALKTAHFAAELNLPSKLAEIKKKI